MSYEVRVFTDPEATSDRGPWDLSHTGATLLVTDSYPDAVQYAEEHALDHYYGTCIVDCWDMRPKRVRSRILPHHMMIFKALRDYGATDDEVANLTETTDLSDVIDEVALAHQRLSSLRGEDVPA